MKIMYIEINKTKQNRKNLKVRNEVNNIRDWRDKFQEITAPKEQVRIALRRNATVNLCNLRDCTRQKGIIGKGRLVYNEVDNVKLNYNLIKDLILTLKYTS